MSPKHWTGEIVDGELIVTPRQSRSHVFATTALGHKVTGPYQFGEGDGPGGWIILIGPEIGLAGNVLVPDLAGWCRERFPVSEDQNWISVCPDWVCEVLSAGTARTDKTDKMPIYALQGVSYISGFLLAQRNRPLRACFFAEEFRKSYFLLFLLSLTDASPIRPLPIRIKVPGSGTGVPTDDPLRSPSKLGLPLGLMF